MLQAHTDQAAWDAERQNLILAQNYTQALLQCITTSLYGSELMAAEAELEACNCTGGLCDYFQQQLAWMQTRPTCVEALAALPASLAAFVENLKNFTDTTGLAFSEGRAANATMTESAQVWDRLTVYPPVFAQTRRCAKALQNVFSPGGSVTSRHQPSSDSDGSQGMADAVCSNCNIVSWL